MTISNFLSSGIALLLLGRKFHPQFQFGRSIGKFIFIFGPKGRRFCASPSRPNFSLPRGLLKAYTEHLFFLFQFQQIVRARPALKYLFMEDFSFEDNGRISVLELEMKNPTGQSLIKKQVTFMQPFIDFSRAT